MNRYLLAGSVSVSVPLDTLCFFNRLKFCLPVLAIVLAVLAGFSDQAFAATRQYPAGRAMVNDTFDVRVDGLGETAGSLAAMPANTVLAESGVPAASSIGGNLPTEVPHDTTGGPDEKWRGRFLRVALSGPYEPFLFIDKDGRPSGFDLDIAMALCGELEVECRFTNKRFDELVPALVADEFDFAVAGIAVTPEREHLVDFTNRYFRSHSIFVSAEDRFKGLSAGELAGKRIGTQHGSVQANYLQNRYPGAELVLAGTFGELFDWLRTGRVDIVLVEGLPAYTFLQTRAGIGLEIVGAPLRDASLNDSACIAVNRRNKGLRDALNSALEQVFYNGTYERINRKYFNFTIY